MLGTENLMDDEYTTVIYKFRVGNLVGRVIVLLMHSLWPCEIIISLPGASDAIVAEYAVQASKMTKCLYGDTPIEEIVRKFSYFRVATEFGGRTSEPELLKVGSVMEIVLWWLKHKLPSAIADRYLPSVIA